MQKETFRIAPEYRNHLGFIYRITFNCNGRMFTYIGKKLFSSKPNWKYYKSSSINVKNLIKYGYPVEYQVLGFSDNSRDLAKIESYLILKEWISNIKLSLNECSFAMDRKIYRINFNKTFNGHELYEMNENIIKWEKKLIKIETKKENHFNNMIKELEVEI